MNELLVKGRIIEPKCPLVLPADNLNAPYWLNPGLCEIWGKTIMVYRVKRFPSLLYLSELDNNYNPIDYNLLGDLGDWSEDARLFVQGDNIGVFYFKAMPLPLMYYAEITKSYDIVNKHPIRFRRSDYVPKNWIPFVKDGKTFVIYHHSPFTILEYNDDLCKSVFVGEDINEKWIYGSLRGGTPPVKMNGSWYTFFHSSQEGKNKVRVYFVGCCVFDDEFHIQKITLSPIMHGDADEYTTPWENNQKISALFPCGAILRDENWILSYGYLDSTVKIAEIPVSEIERTLSPF